MYIASLGDLASLIPPTNILIEESDDIKRETLQELMRRGLVHGSDHENNEISDLQSRSLVDLLGEYRPDLGLIVIYTAMCQRISEHIGIGLTELVAIVRVHEEAHAVTHLGKDKEGRIWTHFSIAPNADKEQAAQLLTLLYCRAASQPSLLQAFRSLAEHQHEPYNSWRNYENADQNEIVSVIHELRQRGCNLILDYCSFGGGPLGFGGRGLHYRVKGDGTFLHLLRPRSGIFGPGSSRHDVVLRQVVRHLESSEHLPTEILKLSVFLGEAGKRWPTTSALRWHVSGAVIDILEGMLNLEEEHFDVHVFKPSEAAFAQLLAASRAAMAVTRQGSLEQHGVMDAPIRQLTIWLDGEWKTWWGNVGWQIPALEALDARILSAVQSATSG